MLGNRRHSIFYSSVLVFSVLIPLLSPDFLTANGGASAISFGPYYVYLLEITDVSVSDDLQLETRSDSYSVTKHAQQYVLTIPKSARLPEQTAGWSLTVRLYNPETVSLGSASPNVLICEPEFGPGVCSSEIVTNASHIFVKPRNVPEIADSLGVSADDLKTSMNFTIYGQFVESGGQFTMYGTLLIDNTKESKMAYEESIRRSGTLWALGNVMTPIWLILLPVGFFGLIVGLIVISGAMKPSPPQKLTLLRQMLLAGFPTFATQLYAFWKVNKERKGILILIASWSSIMVIPALFEELVVEYNLRWGVLHILGLWVLIISTITVIPLLVARKWTNDYNRNFDHPFSMST